jgi:hypothetical protein
MAGYRNNPRTEEHKCEGCGDAVAKLYRVADMEVCKRCLKADLKHTLELMAEAIRNRCVLGKDRNEPDA